MTIKLTNKPVDRNGKFTPECAKYVNGQLAMNGINSWGDAP